MSRSSQYNVPEHIFACRFDRQTVILDLKSDRYQLLGGKIAQAFWGVALRNTPSQCGDKRRPLSWEEPDEQVMHKLVQSGFLIQSRGAPQYRVFNYDSSLPPATKELTIDSASKFSFSSARRAIHATIHSAVSRRSQLLENTVNKIKKQKRRIRTTEEDQDERVSELVSEFIRCRPFLYSHAQECYFDCMVLMHYLLSAKVKSEWVFGVKLDPFMAHCWVQFGDFVLNDRLEHIADYKPILIV